MKKVLFVTPILEHPPSGGPFLRIENSIKALNKICELHIVSRVSKDKIGGEKAELFYRAIAQNFLYSPSVSPKGSSFSYKAFLILSLYKNESKIKKVLL